MHGSYTCVQIHDGEGAPLPFEVKPFDQGTPQAYFSVRLQGYNTVLYVNRARLVELQSRITEALEETYEAAATMGRASALDEQAAHEEHMLMDRCSTPETEGLHAAQPEPEPECECVNSTGRWDLEESVDARNCPVHGPNGTKAKEERAREATENAAWAERMAGVFGPEAA
jgi:hypothetical protein